MKKLLASSLAVLILANIGAAAARDTINIVGSSTVYPFATVVAERFGKSTSFKAPKVESTGSGSGLKYFCKGVGVATADITNSSRRIKLSEFEDCHRNGVTQIVEVLIGYDGIVLANAKGSPPLELSRKDIYLALAKMVPGKDGKLIENPNITWNQVNPSLPVQKIEVLGPPPSSGTRDAFVELALEGGAREFAELAKLRSLKSESQAKITVMAEKLGISSAWQSVVAKKGAAAKGKDLLKIIGRSVREDGAYIEAGENDNLIVNKLVANPNAMGIFGYSFLDQNSDMVQGSIIDGVEPNFEAISGGKYAVSRPLYFYVKKAHVGTVPGIAEYLNAFLSEDAIGDEGYLVDKGLIPLDADKYSAMATSAKMLSNLEL